MPPQATQLRLARLLSHPIRGAPPPPSRADPAPPAPRAKAAPATPAARPPPPWLPRRWRTLARRRSRLSAELPWLAARRAAAWGLSQQVSRFGAVFDGRPGMGGSAGAAFAERAAFAVYSSLSVLLPTGVLSTAAGLTRLRDISCFRHRLHRPALAACGAGEPVLALAVAAGRGGGSSPLMLPRAQSLAPPRLPQLAVAPPPPSRRRSVRPPSWPPTQACCALLAVPRRAPPPFLERLCFAPNRSSSNPASPSASGAVTTARPDGERRERLPRPAPPPAPPAPPPPRRVDRSQGSRSLAALGERSRVPRPPPPLRFISRACHQRTSGRVRAGVPSLLAAILPACVCPHKTSPVVPARLTRAQCTGSYPVHVSASSLASKNRLLSMGARACQRSKADCCCPWHK